MPFRAAFDCLWCGRPHQTRSTSDLEGWAGLCPDCLGRAGDNTFLRFRLHAAIEERARAAGGGERGRREPAGVGAAAAGRRQEERGPAEARAPQRVGAASDGQLKAYYAARAPEYDDVYLRRGRHSRGPLLDLAWHAELDEVTRWLDELPLSGEIVELAAGTGWWSPLLAQKGELWLYDANPEPLEYARRRLLAHGLRAHLHVRDAWDAPDRQVDAVFCGFWLSHVPRDRLGAFLALVARWLKPGGRFACIDERRGPSEGGAETEDTRPAGADVAVRRLADGREFTIPKILYRPDELTAALEQAGFGEIAIGQTARHFLTGSAQR